MANWNYGGYVAPSSVSSKNDVRNIQKQLGVQVDGLWGPETQAAYERSGMGASQPASFNYGTTDLDALYNQVLSNLQAPRISYAMPSQTELAAQISEYLRPGYDSAITQRKQQTLQNRAAIDADAASRGMGRSSYVTDVKDQAMDAEAADIASLESAYNSDLLERVMSQYNQHLQNQLAVDQYNSSAAAAAQQAALGYATNLYSQNLAKQEASAKTSRSPKTKTPSFSMADEMALEEIGDKIVASGNIQNLVREYENRGHLDQYYGDGATDYMLSYVMGRMNR